MGSDRPSWMIYGANGYTGELIAREAVKRRHRPILAGRSRAKIEALARELDLPCRAFDLDRPDLDGVSMVLHCAGPFSKTSKPMVDACLDRGVHYLDITGEIGVFESIFARDGEAKQRGVTLLPGVGFDVVPTDALAAMLAARLPGATELWLAFYSERGGISPGTMKTSIEGAAHGGAIRREGRIVRVPLVYDAREIPFSTGKKFAVTIPWGDVSTAYRTTGIPNIRVYTARSPKSVKSLRRMAPLFPLLRVPPLKWIAQRLAGRQRGPDEQRRASARMHLWGRAARGDQEVTMTMSVPEGYAFTVLSSIAAVEKLLAGATRPGSFTPTQLLGADFVRTIPGVTAG